MSTVTGHNVRSGSPSDLTKWGDLCGRAGQRHDVPQQTRQALQWADQCLKVAADRNHRAWAMWSEQKDRNAEQLAQLIAFALQLLSPRPATTTASSPSPSAGSVAPAGSAPTARPPSRPAPADWVRMAREQTGYGEGSNQRAKAWLEAVYGQMEERIMRGSSTEERALLRLDLQNVLAAIRSVR